MSYELRVSWRHLCSRKSHKFISLITFISVGGVALGVMALIVVIAVMSGFGKNLRDKILGTNSHIVITSFERGGITDFERIVNEAKSVDQVKNAAPFILKQVMLTYGQRTSGVVVRGVDPDREGNISDLRANMERGRLEDLSEGKESSPGKKKFKRKGIILGTELSRTLGADVGDVIGILSPSVRMTPSALFPI